MKRTLLLEIGAEEIPSAPLYKAIKQLEKKTAAALQSARLEFGDVYASGTPRRLAVMVSDVADAQSDLDEKAKGPSVAHAFDDEGAPTKAALGFARSRGVDVADLVRDEVDGQEYLFAVVREEGRPALEVLPEVLAGLISEIEWPKAMRWGSGSVRFSRPIRWLVCLLGDDVVPVEHAGLVADRHSRGHRLLAPGPVEISVAAQYGRALGRAKVMVDLVERTALVRQAVETAAAQARAKPVIHDTTFDEVVNLVEWPTPAFGRFDEEYLDVPREILESAMESHQRYFPLEDDAGELIAAFGVVHNGDPARTQEIVKGHERVIRARLADAKFFVDEDLSRPLEEYVHRLDSIVFQERLGTVAARVERIEALVSALAAQAGAEADETVWAERAAHLCKADLVTSAVVEFPTLQGVMGRHYALASGEAPQVAEAVVEHYRPRFAGDDPPASLAGALVSIADKLDTMVGVFAIGMPPTGSADPYALRRGAIGILNVIIDRDMRLGLDEAIASALAGYTDTIDGLEVQQTGTAVKEYILARMETVLKDLGHAYDTIGAVLASAGDDPADAAARARALTAVRGESTIEDVSVAFARAKNLGDPSLGTGADRALMGDEEAALADALDAAAAQADVAMAAGDFPAMLVLLAGLRGPIDAFFDAVLVMDEDEALRTNRLRLLNRFVEVFSRFADFSLLVE